MRAHARQAVPPTCSFRFAFFFCAAVNGTFAAPTVSACAAAHSPAWLSALLFKTVTPPGPREQTKPGWLSALLFKKTGCSTRVAQADAI